MIVMGVCCRGILAAYWTALEILNISLEWTVKESRVATFRMEVLAALRENESLEALFMKGPATMTPYVILENHNAYVAALQPNTTLKRLKLSHLCMDENESKDLFTVLKKNYGLDAFLGISHDSGDMRSIFELNRAGRRYLVQDGSSISKGVAVLSRVNDDINSVFLHLLENPRLCDRSAVEMSRTSIGNMDNVGSTSPGNRHSGEITREQQAPSRTGMETCRRLE